MMKNIGYVILVSLLTINCSVQKNVNEYDLRTEIDTTINMLISKGINKIIVFAKYSPISYSMADIYYQDNDVFYIENLYQNRGEKTVRQKREASSNLINIIFTENQEKIINSLTNLSVLEKDFSHGRSFYFRIIDTNIDIERTYCCGINSNIDVYYQAKELWELMAAFKLENY